MDQPIPVFYLQLEKTIQKIAESIKLEGKAPFLTHKELRCDRVLATCTLMYNNDLANLHYNYTCYREAVLSTHQQILIGCNDLDLVLKPAISFLHGNGTLLHYEDPLLSDLYFMDPQWLCDMLARIVTVRDSINPLVSDGRL